MKPNIKKNFTVIAAFLLLLSTISFAGSPQVSTFSTSSSAIAYAPGEVLIQFKERSQVNSVNTVNTIRNLLGQNQFTQKLFNRFSAMFIKSSNLSTEDLINILSQMDSVESVSPNYIRHLTTNDTYYTSLWGLNNTGQSSGTEDADIDAQEAWDLQTGSRSVVVAVVDTGIDYTHPDLIGNMWDGSAFGAPHHGWDFAGDSNGRDDNDPNPGNESNLRHGTHVAGTIGATANNSRGVVGVSQQVSLMAINVFRPNGSGYDSDILQAMQYISEKIDQGVNVVAINASYGGGGYSSTMKNAIANLGSKGVVFCAAAGNNGRNNDSTAFYPANYNLDNIISVAATDRNDALASFSNYGSATVDIAAPGVAIKSTVPGNGYATWNGTSMAAPHVAGAVALLAANTPTSSVSQRVNTLLSTVDVISSLDGKVSTGGRLNINNALIADNDNGGGNPDPTPTPTPTPEPTATPGPTPEPTPTPDPDDVTTWTTGAYSNRADISQVLSISGASSLTVSVTGETERRYDFIYIYDENGNQIARFDGSIDETLTVQGSSITARLTSDYSVTKSGVTVTITSNGGTPTPSPTPTATPSPTPTATPSPTPTASPSPTPTATPAPTPTPEPTPTPDPDDVTTWTTGAYSNRTDISQALSINGATSLTVTITGETERRYDFIYIYDENGNQIARFDGSIDETLTLQGSSITARLTSDYSVTKSGVTVTIAESP